MKTITHILIISGDPFDRESFIDYCKREGLEIETRISFDFRDAEKIISSSEIDLVITDFQIGSRSVFDFLDKVGRIPWIVLTGYGSENIAVQSIKSGAADYFVKDPNQSYLPLLVNSIRKSICQSKDPEAGPIEEDSNLEKSLQLLKEETMQRERVQESLKESRQIYHQFFQASSDAAFISSKDGRWIDMNQSALEMFGYQKREDIWSDSIINVYWEPEDQIEFTSRLNEQGSIQDHPVSFKSRDGMKIETLVSAAPYVIGGNLIGYQGFIRDITAEINAGIVQEALDQLSRDLGSSLSPEKIYKSMEQQIRRLLQPDAIQIHRISTDQKVGQAEFSWQTNNCPPELDLEALFVINLDESVLEKVIKDRDVISMHGLADSTVEVNNGRSGSNGKKDLPTPVDEGKDYGSTLIAPLIVDDQAIALIQLIDRDPFRFQIDDCDLISRITNLVAIGLQKAYLYQESQVLVRKLTSLQRIEGTVLENLSLPITLDMLVEQLVKELGIDAADILYLHPKLKTLKFITQTGFRQNILQHTDMEVGEGLAGKAALSQELVRVEDLKAADVDSPRSLAFLTEGFHSYVGVPLLAKGRVVGVMELFQRNPLQIDQAWLDLLDMVAGLAAIAIDHQNLHNTLKRSQAEVTQSLDVILEGWAQALELRGIESPGHWRRVVDLALELATKLGLEGDDLINIRRGALLHDIGKMSIPDQILHKRNRLTDAELDLIRRHPVEAYNLLKPVEGLMSALDIPLYHHERWDGKGYPYQLAEEDIPYHARIFAVVDVWDALLSDRPYRKAFSRGDALTHMREQASKHFDPAVVEVFLELLGELEEKIPVKKVREN